MIDQWRVRIHPGNTTGDTEGCILVGRGRERNIITDSRAAFGPLYADIEAAIAARTWARVSDRPRALAGLYARRRWRGGCRR